MRKIQLFLIFILTFTISFCLSSCKKKTTSIKSIDKTILTIPNANKDIVEIKDDVLIKDNTTEYKIVVRKDAAFLENYAADELQKYIESSTGVLIPIITDDLADISNKLILIGNTKFMEITDKSVIKDEGYIIKTIDDDIYLIGGTPTGTVYSVYGLLNKLIGFKVYAVDEIYYQKVNQINLYNFDIVDVPSFETRSINSPSFNASGKIFDCLLMRVTANDSNGFGALKMNDSGEVVRDWGLYAHSIGTSLLKWSDYHDEHPEWFEGNELYGENAGYQIWMTNDDVIKEVANNLKKYFTDYPYSKYFMVGINDNSVVHKKDQSFADSNGGFGGVYIYFLNRIDDIIKEWLKAEGIDREYYIVGIAYEKYQYAPCDDDLNPASTKVIANDNVGMMYCPIDIDWGSPLDDENNERNKTAMLSLKKWNKIVKNNLFIWTYSTSFKRYLIDFNNYSTISTAYKYYKTYGVFYNFDQNVAQSNIPFKPLRDYLQSELMWDVNQNTIELIDDFIDNYYKIASPYVKEYFYLIRSRYQYLKDNNILTLIYVGNNTRGEILKEEYFSYQFCIEFMNLVNEAIDKINQSTISNELKETLINRVKLDSIMPRYIILSLYRSKMTSTEYSLMIDEFESDCNNFNVKNYCETYGSVNITDAIASFRGKI